METRTERITNEAGCAEVATIIHNGHEFTAMGAAVYENPGTGKLEGILYAPTNTLGGVGASVLTSWNGKIQIPCTLGSVWENSFVDYHGRRQVNQSFYFTIKGRKCRGVNYNREWSQIVRFKEV